MDCLFGTCSDNIAGYCQLHRKGMTVKQIKQKECLKKQCNHLKKNEVHDYWRYRETIKNKRRERKDRINLTGGIN